MNEIQMWLTGMILVGGGTCVVGFTGFAFYITQRVTRLEASWEQFGVNAIKALHGPTDHIGLDGLVEKYEANNHDLPTEDWEIIFQVCTNLANNRERPTAERIGLSLAAAFTNHKLMRSGRSHSKKML
ncbi:MAG: hypothetical protein KGL39_26415 [Patescibacteria group bacterium]|nr:hypothetical protein [Patescibacteria group bacterium]